MKHRKNRPLGKGVRDLCDSARSWCAKVESLSSTAGPAGLPATLARAFAPVLAGTKPPPDLRGLTLLLVNAIHQLIARLLEEERVHQQTLAALPTVRGRRDAICRELYEKLKTLRLVGLANRCGQVIPPGELPRQPGRLAAVAAVVRPRLDDPELKAAFGVKMAPTLRPGFERTCDELTAASAAVDEGVRRSRESRQDRSSTMDELRAHVTAARSLHQTLSDLRSLDR